MAAKVMFLDESGDHSLTAIDPQYPMFVLGGVIVEESYALGELERRVGRFKRDLFGHDDIILHTADISRNKNGFERLIEPNFRRRFYDELNVLMRELNYTVVACAIKKDAHLGKYGMRAVDPYMLCLDILVERFCFEIGDVANGGLIVAEKRDPTLDHQLELAWLNLKIQGTGFVQAKTIDARIQGLRSRPKTDNIAGLQLADLVVSPIGRFVLGKPTKEDWSIIEAKFRRYKGTYNGAGLVVLPKRATEKNKARTRIRSSRPLRKV
jgi:hypothetical protein